MSSEGGAQGGREARLDADLPDHRLTQDCPCPGSGSARRRPLASTLCPAWGLLARSTH